MTSMSQSHRVLKRANPKTIQNKFLVGYQGWFTCAGDGAPVHQGHHGWVHWFDKPLPDGGHSNTDLWPDLSEYSPSELFPVPGLTLEDGRPATLFSSRNPKTVQRHFNWMAQHGVDGAFLQRFAGQCEVDGRTQGGNADIMRLRDEVGDRVREAAEKEGRVFAIMYDVSGVPADHIERVIAVDWVHLVRDKAILDSPNYLKEQGKPVIALWGFGFEGRGHDPGVVRNIVRHLRANTPGGAYVMAGAPTHWQTLTGDADPNPAFLGVWYNEFDAISPWTIGRYNDEESADRFAVEKVRKDMQALATNTHGRRVDYIPVVFPGGSGFNLSQGQWELNGIKRNGGRFLWHQIHNVRREGARIIYGAMWDEYDEGTAFLPVVASKRQLPRPGKFLALDADGYDLPPDWYMRICGFASESLHGDRVITETFPYKELQDYWSSRPHYEDPGTSVSSSCSAGGSGSGSNVEQDSGASQSFEAWSEATKEEGEDLPPPPYTLEASEEAPVPEPAAVATGTVAGPPAQLAQPEQLRVSIPPTVPTSSRPSSSISPAPNSTSFPLTSPGVNTPVPTVSPYVPPSRASSLSGTRPPVHPLTRPPSTSRPYGPHLPHGSRLQTAGVPSAYNAPQGQPRPPSAGGYAGPSQVAPVVTPYGSQQPMSTSAVGGASSQGPSSSPIRYSPQQSQHPAIYNSQQQLPTTAGNGLPQSIPHSPGAFGIQHTSGPAVPFASRPPAAASGPSQPPYLAQQHQQSGFGPPSAYHSYVEDFNRLSMLQTTVSYPPAVAHHSSLQLGPPPPQTPSSGAQWPPPEWQVPQPAGHGSYSFPHQPPAAGPSSPYVSPMPSATPSPYGPHTPPPPPQSFPSGPQHGPSPGPNRHPSMAARPPASSGSYFPDAYPDPIRPLSTNHSPYPQSSYPQSSYPQHQQSTYPGQFPQANHPSFPVTPSSMPPAPPLASRPGSGGMPPTGPQGSGSPTVLSGAAAGALTFALGAVERVGGNDRRKQLEKGVDTIASAGTKLFGKFK